MKSLIGTTGQSVAGIIERFNHTRKKSEEICEPLALEDYSVQPTEDVSPPKWHLAHSTWFFEQFVLSSYLANFKTYDEDFAYLFNSYYNNAGQRVLRPNRGLMTRPTVEQVYQYRTYITSKVNELLKQNPNKEILSIIEIGINHEQQHQELLAYDIKYILGHQPTFPIYDNCFQLKEESKQATRFTIIKEGIYTIGHQATCEKEGHEEFCFDNELGAHQVFLHDFEIANQLVVNKEYIEFIESGAYQNFNLWHAEGWDWVNDNKITAPLYWHKVDGVWHYYNYKGLQAVNPKLPVIHISFYEAFAFAEWKGMRLPTEFEWEVASGNLNWGQAWEWTGSAYLPYPNFTKAPGALGEYNGKFMVSQHVLRGASVATPAGHSRHTYRNFFHPKMRWMFSGIRLVK